MTSSIPLVPLLPNESDYPVRSDVDAGALGKRPRMSDYPDTEFSQNLPKRPDGRDVTGAPAEVARFEHQVFGIPYMLQPSEKIGLTSREDQWDWLTNLEPGDFIFGKKPSSLDPKISDGGRSLDAGLLYPPIQLIEARQLECVLMWRSLKMMFSSDPTRRYGGTKCTQADFWYDAPPNKKGLERFGKRQCALLFGMVNDYVPYGILVSNPHKGFPHRRGITGTNKDVQDAVAMKVIETNFGCTNYWYDGMEETLFVGQNCFFRFHLMKMKPNKPMKFKLGSKAEFTLPEQNIMKEALFQQEYYVVQIKAIKSHYPYLFRFNDEAEDNLTPQERAKLRHRDFYMPQVHEEVSRSIAEKREINTKKIVKMFRRKVKNGRLKECNPGHFVKDIRVGSISKQIKGHGKYPHDPMRIDLFDSRKVYKTVMNVNVRSDHFC